MTIIAGIDPGITGAVAIIEDGRYLDGLLMPTITNGKRKRCNAAALAGFLVRHRPALVVLERVGAMPKQGATSMFSFGHSAGVAEGVVIALGLPLILVAPPVWKRRAGLLGSDKDAARSAAARLFPDAPLSMRKYGGLADALLMAYYRQSVED